MSESLTAIIDLAAQALKSKRFADFQTEIAKADAINPDDPRVLHFKGLYQFETGNAKGALPYLNRALQARPNNAASARV